MLKFLDWLGVPIEWLCWLQLHGELIGKAGVNSYWECPNCKKRWVTKPEYGYYSPVKQTWLDGGPWA